MCVVPKMKSRYLLLEEFIHEINREIPLDENIEQVYDHQVDHEEVNEEEQGASFVLEFRPVYFEHVTKILQKPKCLPCGAFSDNYPNF